MRTSEGPTRKAIAVAVAAAAANDSDILMDSAQDYSGSTVGGPDDIYNTDQTDSKGPKSAPSRSSQAAYARLLKHLKAHIEDTRIT